MPILPAVFKFVAAYSLDVKSVTQTSRNAATNSPARAHDSCACEVSEPNNVRSRNRSSLLTIYPDKKTDTTVDTAANCVASRSE